MTDVDQDTLEFLMRFFSNSDSSASAPNPPSNSGSGNADADEDVDDGGDGVYLQYMEMKRLCVCVSYTPKRVDFSGLRGGDYAQLVHLFPLEKAHLELKRIVLRGVAGWSRCIDSTIAEWAMHIASHQAHRYVAGVQPIRSLVRVSYQPSPSLSPSPLPSPYHHLERPRYTLSPSPSPSRPSLHSGWQRIRRSRVCAGTTIPTWSWPGSWA